jgi:hypothetical protein
MNPILLDCGMYASNKENTRRFELHAQLVLGDWIVRSSTIVYQYYFHTISIDHSVKIAISMKIAFPYYFQRRSILFP